ncbi:hypothetical protein B5S30_g3263 [[Candida] boidinii]|nr:hypothetical protein B5S30_g3263 [[Candida] boidinii]
MNITTTKVDLFAVSVRNSIEQQEQHLQQLQPQPKQPTSLIGSGIIHEVSEEGSEYTNNNGGSSLLRSNSTNLSRKHSLLKTPLSSKIQHEQVSSSSSMSSFSNSYYTNSANTTIATSDPLEQITSAIKRTITRTASVSKSFSSNLTSSPQEAVNTIQPTSLQQDIIYNSRRCSDVSTSSYATASSYGLEDFNNDYSPCQQISQVQQAAQQQNSSPLITSFGKLRSKLKRSVSKKNGSVPTLTRLDSSLSINSLGTTGTNTTTATIGCGGLTSPIALTNSAVSEKTSGFPFNNHKNSISGNTDSTSSLVFLTQSYNNNSTNINNNNNNNSASTIQSTHSPNLLNTNGFLNQNSSSSSIIPPSFARNRSLSSPISPIFNPGFDNSVTSANGNNNNGSTGLLLNRKNSIVNSNSVNNNYNSNSHSASILQLPFQSKQTDIADEYFKVNGGINGNNNWSNSNGSNLNANYNGNSDNFMGNGNVDLSSVGFAKDSYFLDEYELQSNDNLIYDGDNLSSYAGSTISRRISDVNVNSYHTSSNSGSGSGTGSVPNEISNNNLASYSNFTSSQNNTFNSSSVISVSTTASSAVPRFNAYVEEQPVHVTNTPGGWSVKDGLLVTKKESLMTIVPETNDENDDADRTQIHQDANSNMINISNGQFSDLEIYQHILPEEDGEDEEGESFDLSVGDYKETQTTLPKNISNDPKINETVNLTQDLNNLKVID